MQRPPITLLAQRDFGQKINATFEFVTQNAKPLIKALLMIVGPFGLIAGIANGINASRMLPGSNSDPLSAFNQYTSGASLLTNVLSGITSLLVAGTVYSFIALYEEDGSSNALTPGRVWGNFSNQIGTLLGSGVLYFLIIILGVLLLILPGIFAAIALSLYSIVIIREKASAQESLRRSYELTKGKWWSTFGLIFVIGFIAAIISMLFLIPTFVLSALGSLSLNQEFGGQNILMVLANILGIAGSILMQAIVAVAMAFQYYNLVELKEGSSIQSAINTIGSPETMRPDREDTF